MYRDWISVTFCGRLPQKIIKSDWAERNICWPANHIFNWDSIRAWPACFGDGAPVKHYWFSRVGLKLEPFPAVCARLWSARQPCNIQLHVENQVYISRHRKKSFLGKELFNYQSSRIDWKLAVGSVCFGLGWGIAGLCPGPGIMHLAIFTLPVAVIWLLALVVGMFL